MKRLLFMPILLLFCGLLNANELPQYAMPGTQIVPLKDTTTDRQYELYIKLPEEYSKDKSYPVIYFTDAVWHIEALSSSTFFLFDEVILVGISWQKNIDPTLLLEEGPFVSRYADYSFTESKNGEHQQKYQFGQANTHAAFIRKQVIQYVENNYSVKPNSRSYFGYSLGGLFGAYILLTQPDTFDNYMLGSPSVRQLDALKALPKQSLKGKVFISVGTEEHKRAPQIDAFIGYLNSTQSNGLSVHKTMPDGTHQTAFPETVIRSINWLKSIYESSQ
ncbi:alpha/beta hydrolase [Pseudoalteromonas piscicida]|uniref:alpha/beta hydrolase n=1 Tax=Pseudoalteromonas piscicida TaxID=43662 RepID=UPI0030B30DB0